MENMVFRFAERQDVSLILDFIRRLAEYEKVSQSVTATQEQLEEWLFDRKRAEVLFVEAAGKAVGFALFFESFATYPGKGGIYIDDLFVLEEYRGKGYGKALFQQLARLTVERGGIRMEWLCLNWNRTGITFYRSVGGKAVESCMTYRMEAEALREFAGANLAADREKR